MTMTLSGDGTITGLVAGGLPNATVTADDLAAGAALNSVSDGVFFRNRIINGDMRIDQRNAGASVTPADGGYTLDRFAGFRNGDGIFSVQQSSTAPAGFTNSLVATVTTADASLGATDFGGIYQSIEGYNVADLGFGTASAKTITVSFWVRSNLTGTYSIALRNSAANRAYVAEYSISSADTWEQKTLTIAGDTSGTWLTTNGNGLQIRWCLWEGGFSTTPNSWQAGNYIGSSNNVNWAATLSNNFYLTGVQLEVGSVATPFERRPYGTELSLCQRYCQNFRAAEWSDIYRRYATVLLHTATTYNGIIPLLVKMRANPTLTTGGNFNLWNGSFLGSVSAPTIASTSPDVVDIAGTNGSGTSGGIYHLLSDGNSTSYMLFTAEL